MTHNDSLDGRSIPVPDPATTDDAATPRLPWTRPTLTQASVTGDTAAGCTPCPDSGCATARS